MPSSVISTQYIRDQVTLVVDPKILKLRQDLYGSGITYNTYISTTVIPPTVVFDDQLNQKVGDLGYIKGIKTYSGGVLKGSNQTELNFVGAGVTVAGVRTTITIPSGSVVGIIPISSGGTGQTTALAAFNALSPLTTRGDLLTRNATNNIRLAIGASGRYIRSDGVDPSWHTLDFSDLVYTGLTTGQVLRATGTTSAAFGALDLANSSAVTGILPAANGGTGINNSARTLTISTNGGTLDFTTSSSTLTIPTTGTAALRASSATAGRIAFWSSATDISHDSNLFWDNTNKYIGIGTSSPTTLLHIHSTSVAQTLVLSSFAPGLEFRDNVVQGSRTTAGFFGFSTANGHYGALKGDLNFITASFSSGNNSAINFLTADDDSGTYSKKLTIDSTGSVISAVLDSASSSVSTAFTFNHNSTGTAATGFGSDYSFNLESSTTINRNAMLIRVFWATATDASRKATTRIFMSDTVSRQVIEMGASGSAATIGFLGSAAVARPSVTGTRTGTLAQLQTVVANLLTALGSTSLGLISDSTS